jgi:hypothetical protein
MATIDNIAYISIEISTVCLSQDKFEALHSLLDRVKHNS